MVVFMVVVVLVLVVTLLFVSFLFPHFVVCCLCCCLSFDGPDWGMSSSGARRGSCLRALASAVEADKQVRGTRFPFGRWVVQG